MKAIISLFILILILSANGKHENRFLEKNIPNIHASFDSTLQKLKLDGVYQEEFIPLQITDNHPKYCFREFITFFNNGYCTSTKLFGYSDSADALNKIGSSNHQEIIKGGGIFTIYDTNKIRLLVRIQTTKFGGRIAYSFTLFEGIINKTGDTISNFKMITPYPKHFNWADTISRSLAYQPFPAKLTLDSNNYYIKKFIK